MAKLPEFFHFRVLGGGTKIGIQDVSDYDFVEVVRCKDCHHRDPEDHKCDSGQLERAGCVFPVNDDYFCAYGEKREES